MNHQHLDFEPEAINLRGRTLTASPAVTQQESQNEIEQAPLPPADRRKEAWLVLLGCSLIQFPVWGSHLGAPPLLPQTTYPRLPVLRRTPNQPQLHPAPLLLDAPNRQRPTITRLFPPLHLPLHLRLQQLHVSTTVATNLLVLINVTSIPGGIVMGSLGDHLRVTTVILISTIGSALAVFLFWGFSSQTALLAVFSITYGFFAGGFSSTWSGVLSELKAESPAVDTGFIFGLLAGGRGIGNVISGPLSVALLTGDGWIRDGKGWRYSGQCGGIILFTGVTAMLGGWDALGRVKCICAR
ncbi:hypothetical protein BDP67DRAFT_22182 [Colletotrichum lupini]|nr:hypothetical protein BDP67DRAFT_22182 [Colletotrichum lupini]